MGDCYTEFSAFVFCSFVFPWFLCLLCYFFSCCSVFALVLCFHVQHCFLCLLLFFVLKFNSVSCVCSCSLFSSSTVFLVFALVIKIFLCLRLFFVLVLLPLNCDVLFPLYSKKYLE